MNDQLTYSEIGCGDGNCDFRKPVGMHTNRGCGCFPRHADEYDRAERSRLRRWVRAMRDEIAGLRVELDMMTDDCVAWQEESERNRAAYAESMIRASRLTEALQAATAYIDAMERGDGVTKLGPVRGAYHDALEATR